MEIISSMFVPDRDLANLDEAMSDREPFASKCLCLKTILANLESQLLESESEMKVKWMKWNVSLKTQVKCFTGDGYVTGRRLADVNSNTFDIAVEQVRLLKLTTYGVFEKFRWNSFVGDCFVCYCKYTRSTVCLWHVYNHKNSTKWKFLHSTLRDKQWSYTL